MEEKVTLELTRNRIFTLFNHLLISERSILRRQNEDTEELLYGLWQQVSDRRKYEVLWHKGFRGELNKWNVPYQEDLIRLGIPEVLEDEE